MTMTSEPALETAANAPQTTKGPISTRIGAVAFIATSLTVAILASALGTGSLARPGPGFWPLIISIGTLAVSIAAVLRVEPVEKTTVPQMTRVGLFAAGLAGFLLLFEPAGFPIAAALLLIYILRVISQEPWWRCVIVGVLGAVITFIIFSTLLGVRLPTGPLF